jgi:hypothetical protein
MVTREKILYTRIILKLSNIYYAKENNYAEEKWEEEQYLKDVGSAANFVP